MRALLLAAGLGTRLRPLTDRVPKCLVPVCGQPLLGIWFDLLFRNGVDRALVNTHYLSAAVSDFVQKSPWHPRVDLVHEDALLGTGGTVLANKQWLGANDFMVAHADNLTKFDPQAFFARHASRPPGCDITMMTFDTDSPQSCGIVEENPDGVVVAFHEKVKNPPGHRANAAVYIFAPGVIDFLEGLGKPVIDLSTELLPDFLGRICTFHNDQYHRDIGTLESLALAEAEYAALLEDKR